MVVWTIRTSNERVNAYILVGRTRSTAYLIVLQKRRDVEADLFVCPGGDLPPGEVAEYAVLLGDTNLSCSTPCIRIGSMPFTRLVPKLYEDDKEAIRESGNIADEDNNNRNPDRVYVTSAFLFKFNQKTSSYCGQAYICMYIYIYIYIA